MLSSNEFYLTLIRHGESTQNAIPDLMGQMPDTRLTEKGKKQAWKLGERLASEMVYPDYVFASTYTRAIETAEITLNHYCHPPQIELVEDLREYSAGDWTGKNRKETLSLEVKDRMNMMTHGFLPPNGESLHQVERRASKWLEDRILYNSDIQSEAAKRREKKEDPIHIFCFSHGMTIKCLLHYVLGFDQSFTWKVTIDNTSLSKLYFGKEGWRLLGINDHSHI